MKNERMKDWFTKRVKTKRLFLVAFLSLFLTPYSLFAAKPQPVELTTEQRQQFTYYWYAARQAITEERYKDAYVLLQFCHALEPNDAQTLYFLGVIYTGLHKNQEAQEAFEQAYRAQKGPHSEDLLLRLENIYYDQHNWKKALQIQDELDEVKGYDAMSALTRYRIYASANQPKKAIQAIDKYLETDPDNLRFLLFRVDVLEHMGAKAKVMYAAYEKILELDPYNLAVLNNYAWLLATHKGDLTKAERMSQFTIREAPNNPVYLDTYGWIMHLQGQDELAKFYLQKALWNATDRTKEEVEKHLREIEK